MFITILVDPDFQHPNIRESKFIIDVDPKEPIDNLKVLITLKFADLDPEHFTLVKVGQQQALDMNKPCYSLMNQGDPEQQIQLLMRGINKGCCQLI